MYQPRIIINKKICTYKKNKNK